MAFFITRVCLLFALVSFLAAEEQSRRSEVCKLCTCSRSNPAAADIDTVSCKLFAITPDTTSVLRMQQPIKVKSLSVTCDDKFPSSVISIETIGALEGLEKLHLENCNLAAGLTAASFQGLTRLKTLSINNCELPASSQEMDDASSYLSSISRLESLSLTGCKLFRLPALPNGGHLRYLNISHNNLNHLEIVQSRLSPPKSGHEATGNGKAGKSARNQSPDSYGLEESTSYQPSTHEKNDDEETNGLLVLDASHNPMTSFPASAIVLNPKLEKLVLQGVPLRKLHLSEDIELPELVVLDAPDSQLEDFSFPRLCSSAKLEELYLKGNGAPVAFEGLSCLKNLFRLTLTNLGLTSSIWEQLQSPVLSKLYLENNVLTSVDTSRLTKLRTLVLHGNQISNINSSSSFANLPELQLLNISNNRVSELPGRCFQGTQDLKALDASSNNLTQIQARTFSDLSKLFYLSLASNEISSMSYTVFEDTPSMRWLYLQHNKLNYLPRLNNLKSLNWLNVSYNQIKSIEPRHLEGLDNLTVLFANNNHLQRIRSYMFSKTPRLMEVWLSDNRIKYLGNFGNHDSLVTLLLGSNQIPDFNTGSPFLGLRALQSLDLLDNQITRIRQNTFPNNLRLLFLGFNYIVWIEPYSFANLPRLEYVHLMNNRMIFRFPQNAAYTFEENRPKPQFIVGGNHWFCDCNMAYLKLLHERRYEFEIFPRMYPVFHGLEQTFCEIDYEGIQTKLFKDLPLSEFVCEYPEPYCHTGCLCCDMSITQNDPVNADCHCQLSCPVGCACYVGGAAMLKTYFHIRCDARNLSSVPERIPPLAVNLFLDGNTISNVSRADFSALGELEHLYLNSSALQTLHDGAFENCTVLEYLYLDHNLLTALSSDVFKGLSHLSHLYLHHNDIQLVSPEDFKYLTSVKVVTLHNNRLTKLGAHPGGLPLSLNLLTLSGNPWSCDCGESKELYSLLHFRSRVIVDRHRVCCYFSDDNQPELSSPFMTSADATHRRNKPGTNSAGTQSTIKASTTQPFISEVGVDTKAIELIGDDTMFERHISRAAGDHSSERRKCHTLLLFDLSKYCGDKNFTASWKRPSTDGAGMPTELVILTVLIVVLSLAVSLVLFIIFKRKELQALAYAKLGVRFFDKKVQVDKEDAGSKAFDAFISYSSKDDDFVAGTLVPALEDVKKGYRVCVHYRDFPVGRHITDTICRAIECSSRTILLLSQNFLKSEWCRFEFQTAHRHILREGSHRLVIVLYGDVPEAMLDPDLKVHLRSQSYLRFEDPYFWEKLFFSLPDIRHRRAEEAKREEERGEEGRGEHKQTDVQAAAAERAMRILSGKSMPDVRANCETGV